MRLACMVLSVLLQPGLVLADDMNARCRLAAGEHVAAWSRSDLAPSSWTTAKVVASTMLDNGSLCKCSLESGGHEVGYVIMAFTETGPVPVMWSGSNCPDAYLKAMSIEQPFNSPAPTMASLKCPAKDGMLMVGIPENTPADLRPSPLACCAISVLYWAETQAHQALLYSSDTQCLLRPDMKPPFFINHPEPIANELRDFYAHWPAMDSNPALYETIIGRSGRPSYRMKNPVGILQAIMPSMQSHLLGSLSQRARLDLLELESSLCVEVGGGKVSPGVANAIALESYMKREPQTGLNDFLASRGLSLRWTEQAGSMLNDDGLPCIAVGPNKEALVVAGSLGDKSEWLLVCIPSTVHPELLDRQQAPERLRQRYLRILPHDSGLAQILREKSEEHSKSASSSVGSKPANANEPGLSRDPEFGFPGGMTQGLHIVSRTAISHWRIASLRGLTSTRPE